MSHTLRVAMIVRDEERAVGRAIDSVTPWVDEVVVLDTGSVDDTARIAAAHGARVETFTWIDDFAAARNATIAAADADWTLILDADEWLTAGGDALASLRDEAPTFAGVVQVASTFSLAATDTDHGQTETQTTTSIRLLPRGSTYVGRVHEQPHTGYDRRPWPVTLHHDGYEPRQNARKRGRNERLLRVALTTTPADPYLHYQLGKDLELQRRYDEASAAYLAALDLTPREDWLHDLDARVIYTLKKAARFDEAIRRAEGALERWPTSPDILFALGDALLDMALSDPARATALIPLVEEAWRHCLELGEHPELSGTVRGRGSFLAAQNLAAVREVLGDLDGAQTYRALADDLRSST